MLSKFNKLIHIIPKSRINQQSFYAFSNASKNQGNKINQNEKNSTVDIRGSESQTTVPNRKAQYGSGSHAVGSGFGGGQGRGVDDFGKLNSDFSNSVDQSTKRDINPSQSEQSSRFGSGSHAVGSEFGSGEGRGTDEFGRSVGNSGNRNQERLGFGDNKSSKSISDSGQNAYGSSAGGVNDNSKIEPDISGSNVFGRQSGTSTEHGPQNEFGTGVSKSGEGTGGIKNVGTTQVNIDNKSGLLRNNQKQ